MYSFYGGKQGRTYKLVQHYDSIYQMVLAFQQGGSYNTVNYGEYVIIDTIVNANHQNSPENGIIYRRGMNYTQGFNPTSISLNENNTVSKEDIDPSTGQKRYYQTTIDPYTGDETITFNEELYKSALSTFVQNPGGGAEYIGQIVGPQGEVPQLSILSWDDFIERYENSAANLHKGYLDAFSSPGAEFDENGDVISDSITDHIKYGYLDIKDVDGNITGAYISMDIPHSVFKYHAESIEPYPDYIDQEDDGKGKYFDHQGIAVYDDEQQVWKYTNLITEDNISKNHNYFWQYDIKVPKGVRGQDLEEFDIDIDPTLISQDGNDILSGEDDNNYRYYKIFRNYEKSAQGEITKQYLDSWQRTIHKITNDGHFPDYQIIQRETEYHQGDTVYANGLKSHLYLYATTTGTTSTQQLPPLFNYEKGKIFTDGTVVWQVIEDQIVTPKLLTIHYTHGENDEVAIRVLDDIICDKSNGKIYVKYSDLDSLVYLGQNQSIIGVEYNDSIWVDSSGASHVIDRIFIKYNTYNYDADGRIVTDANFKVDGQGNLIFPTTDSSGRKIQYIDEQFKFLNKIETNRNTKQVFAYYNDGTSNLLGVLKSVSNMYIENQGDLNGSKYFIVEYDNQQGDGSYPTQRLNQNPLNEIACVQQYGDNIIVLYSDHDVRMSLYREGIDYALNNDLYDIPNYNKLSGDDDGQGHLYWINLGSIYHSNHVFGQFPDLLTLKTEYPFGLDKNSQGELIPEYMDHAGWIATIKDASTNTVQMYAYDYNGDPADGGDNWYQLQDLSAQNVDPQWLLLISKPREGNAAVPPADKDALLNEKGYWFVISERAD